MITDEEIEKWAAEYVAGLPIDFYEISDHWLSGFKTALRNYGVQWKKPEEEMPEDMEDVLCLWWVDGENWDASMGRYQVLVKCWADSASARRNPLAWARIELPEWVK